MVNECIPFDNARPYLGAEFGRCLGLATYNGADMGLEDTHDTVGDPVGVVPVHEFLLVVHGDDGFQIPFLITSQGIQQLCAVYRNQPDERTYITHKIVEHETFTFLYSGPGLLLELDQTEIYLPGLFPERGRERKMELPAQLRDITVDDPAAVLKQIHIRGVTHFGITAGGVNLHGAFVESAGAVYEGVRVSGVLPVIPGILLVISGGIFPPYAELQKRIRKTVQVADLKAFADGHEQARIEYRCFRILTQAQHVLHIRILLDGQDGLLIGQVHLMFHNQCADNHAGRLVTGSHITVVQSGIVISLYLIPGEFITHTYPTVGFGKIIQ